MPTEASARQSSAWDISNAPRNYLSLVLTQIGSALFSFGAVWLITRYLGSEGYGGIVAIIATSYVAQVLVNWTAIAVVRFGVDEFIETEKIARTFWVRLIVLVANFALVLLLSGFWFPPLAGWLKLSPDSFWLVTAHFIATAFWIHVQMSLQAAKMPRLQGLMLMMERLLILLGFLGFVLANNFNGTTTMLCYIIVPFAMTFAGVFHLRHYVFARFSIDRPFLKKILAYSLPLLPVWLFGYFSGTYVNAVFVSNYLSTSDLGIYSVATQISGIALQLPTIANALLIPLFITLEKENQTQRLNRFFIDVLPSATLIWGVFCLILSFAGYLTIPLVFGDEFAKAVLPLWVLAAGSCMNLPVLLGYSALSHAISASYISMYAAIFGALTNICFNFLLIPIMGIEGSAWATTLMNLASVVTYALLLRRARKIPISWLFAALWPLIIGALAFSFSGYAFWSFVAGIVAAGLIALINISSLRKSLTFVGNLRG